MILSKNATISKYYCKKRFAGNKRDSYFCHEIYYAIDKFEYMKRLIVTLLVIGVYSSSIAQSVKIAEKVPDEQSDALVAAAISLMPKNSVLISNTKMQKFSKFGLATFDTSLFNFFFHDDIRKITNFHMGKKGYIVVELCPLTLILHQFW
jgi:hypothetical protein